MGITKHEREAWGVDSQRLLPGTRATPAATGLCRSGASGRDLDWLELEVQATVYDEPAGRWLAGFHQPSTNVQVLRGTLGGFQVWLGCRCAQPHSTCTCYSVG